MSVGLIQTCNNSSAGFDAMMVKVEDKYTFPGKLVPILMY